MSCVCVCSSYIKMWWYMSSHMLRFIDVCVLLWESLFFSLTVQISRYNYIWYTLSAFSVWCSVGSPTLWASSSELFELSLLQFGSNIQLSFQTSISWLEFGRGSCYEGAKAMRTQAYDLQWYCILSCCNEFGSLDSTVCLKTLVHLAVKLRVWRTKHVLYVSEWAAANCIICTPDVTMHRSSPWVSVSNRSSRLISLTVVVVRKSKQVCLCR